MLLIITSLKRYSKDVVHRGRTLEVKETHLLILQNIES